jgi:hypothetical protein
VYIAVAFDKHGSPASPLIKKMLLNTKGNGIYNIKVASLDQIEHLDSFGSIKNSASILLSIYYTGFEQPIFPLLQNHVLVTEGFLYQ